MLNSSERKNEMGAEFWNDRYLTSDTGWDLGMVSPPIKVYIDQLTDNNLRILIPGCGNSYEAECLLDQGFTDVTVIDIAPKAVENLQRKFAGKAGINIILGDFFSHTGAYDLVLEQTFFCALDPKLRPAYVAKMHALLAPEGKLVGLLFDRLFEQEGPPFGGTKMEYESLFASGFQFRVMAPCYNSFSKREGTELFIILHRKT